MQLTSCFDPACKHPVCEAGRTLRVTPGADGVNWESGGHVFEQRRGEEPRELLGHDLDAYRRQMADYRARHPGEG